MNTRAAQAEEEKEVGKAEGGDGVESLGVDEEGDAASEEAQIAGAEWTFVAGDIWCLRSASWVQ